MDGSLGTEFLQIVRAGLLNEYPRQVRACLQALDDEDVWWRPNEQSNAVGNLVLHVSASNRYYLEHVIGGEADVRDRDAEFAARGTVTKAHLERIWADTEGRVTRVMNTLSPERLAETTDRSGRVSSFARVLLHVTHHNATHVGQIIWITKLRRPGVLHELARTPPVSSP
ncbi:MAG TPA: DinB family protein [Vicinamibacterales bacterium]|nr:DinB family protein [Vicinamibacterales bacterium]